MNNKKSLIPFKLFCNMVPHLAERMVKSGCDISPVGILDYLTGILIALENFDTIPLEIQCLMKEDPILMDQDLIRSCLNMMNLVVKYDDGTNDVDVQDPFLREYIDNLESETFRDSLSDLPYGYCRKGEYPGLPAELKPYYCYLADCGHNIMIIPKCLLKKAKQSGQYSDYEVPCPVKYVLEKGYKMWEGYVVCDAPYDSKIGLDVPGEYDEF